MKISEHFDKTVWKDSKKYNIQKYEKFEVGPITVNNSNEVYEIRVITKLEPQNWLYIYGEVLNGSKDKLNKLFAFGAELFHYKGIDKEGGRWVEENDYLRLYITFPTPGDYYLSFKNEFKTKPLSMTLVTLKKQGSPKPNSKLAWICGIAACLITFSYYSRYY